MRFKSLGIKFVMSLYILSWLTLERFSLFSKNTEIRSGKRNLQSSLIKVNLSEIFLRGTQLKNRLLAQHSDLVLF